MNNPKPNDPAPRRLGRGLEALLGGNTEGGEVKVAEAGTRPAASMGVQKVPVAKIDPSPYQTRTNFAEAELTELANSMQAQGLINPVVVRLVEGGRYQLIAGERRVRAARKLGWNTIPVTVVQADDRKAAEATITENLQRADLNPLEKAHAFHRYIRAFQCTQEELAKRVSVERSTVANLLRLLELPEAVQKQIATGTLSAGHGRALLPLGDERKQEQFANRIKAENLSVRDTEEIVRTLVEFEDHEPLAKPKEPPSTIPANAHVEALAQEFRELFGTKVDLKVGAKHRGRLVIHFSNNEEFERIQKQLLGRKGKGQAA